MKTVSGKVVSTKSVKLSKAANILSNFVASDNGASQAVSAYLRRASAAFDELVYYKKHFKMKKSQRKEETSTRSDMRTRNLDKEEVRDVANGGVNRKFYQNPVEVDEKGTKNVEGKLRKKEKKKKKIDDNLGSGKTGDIEVELKEDNEIGKEKGQKKKKKKKKIDENLGSGKIGNIEVELEEGNDNVKEKSAEKKRKKKRKNVEIDGGELGNSMSPERKKKRRTEAAQ